jgi:small subunit ribosomal protein S5
MRKFKDKPNKDQVNAPENTLIEKVIHINRVAKVVKGGRNFSFNALVVVGDGEGRVGFGLGKAREVVDAIEKGTDNARRTMKPYPIIRNTLPHSIVGRFGAGKVVIKPATPGTGIIAGGSARAVMECLGVSDVFCKSIGSNNHVNVLRATFDGLGKLISARMMADKRGMSVARVFGLHIMPVKEVFNA